MKGIAPAGGDARGHNIALDTRQAYCGGPGVPPALDTLKSKAASPAGDSLESKLLCLQVSVLSSNLRFVGVENPNPGAEDMKVSRGLSAFGQDLTRMKAEKEGEIARSANHPQTLQPIAL